MIRCELILHPESRCAAVTRIDVEIVRAAPESLSLRYVVSGTIADVRLPPRMEPARTDGLWQHTCFEAFLRTPATDAYYELNFAPSTQWAAYHFDSFRTGMRIASEIAPARIAVYPSKTQLDVQASVQVPSDGIGRLGLSAVIEETNGAKSYWALKHPPGKPDFHHSDCFALELPRPSRA